MSLLGSEPGLRPYCPATPGESDVTICIAAICDNNSIVGASDRMITAGDIQFQPSQAKTRALTSSIVAMTAGDAALQTEVLSRVRSDIDGALAYDPNEWLTVRQVTEWYADHWGEIRRERAERALLKPLGLTHIDFLDRQASLDPKLVQDLANAVLQFAVPDCCCILAGVDPSGAHLFQVENGVLTQRDAIGFAYSGTGGRHAATQLMLAQHSPLSPLPETLMLVYSAKRRAEVAPGVGQETDLWLIGPQLGSFTPVGDEAHGVLDTQFKRIVEDETRALAHAKEGINAFIQKLVDRAAPEIQESPKTIGEG
jgi:hypothetical protein